MTTNSKVLAQPVVVTKAKELLAVADVYKEKGRQAINSIQEYAKERGFDLSAIAQGAKAAKELLPIVKDAKGLLDRGQLLNRILTAAGPNGPLVRLLPDSIQDTVIGGIQDYGSQVVQVQNMISYISSADMSSINGISNLVNRITGDNNLIAFRDQDGLAGMMAGIVHEAKEAGLPNFLSDLTKTVNDTTIAVRTALNSIDTAIKFSDIQMFKDINNMVGPGNLIMAQPNAMDRFIEQYQKDNVYKSKPASELHSDLIDLLDEVTPGWRHATRLAAPETILNAMSIRRGSTTFRDAIKTGVFMNNDPELSIIYAAQVIPNASLDETIRRTMRPNLR